MILTNYYIRKKISSLAKKVPAREHCYRMMDEVKDVVLVYSVEDKDLLEEGIQTLQKLGKKVHICMYIPTGKTYENKADYLPVREASDIDYLMLPKPDVLKKFKDLPADILIDLSHSRDYAMHYMVLMHPALLKVGKKYGDQLLHDFSILPGEEQDIKQLFDQILFYLQTIRSPQTVS